MAGLFGVLNTSSRAMLLNQRGIATVSHNIANVSTPGFSRQRQVVAAERPELTSEGAIGTGARQVTVDRATDGFLHRQLVREQAAAGSLDAQAKALAEIDTLVSEQLGDGISEQITALYGAFHDLSAAAQPGAPDERSILRSAGQSLVDTLHRTDSQLRSLQSTADNTVVALLPEINSLTARIANLNDEIRIQEVVAPANDLRDQREQLMRELSGRIEIDFLEREDGDILVLFDGGLPLVDGNRSATLVEQSDPSNPFDPAYSRVVFRDGPNARDITDQVAGGELGGALRARDTLFGNAIRAIDAIAYNVATTVNQVHQGGRTLESATGAADGRTGVDFFAPLSAVDDAAKLLQLDAEILANVDNIAAGGAAGGGAALDNGNALALSGLETSAAAIFLSGDPIAGPATGSTNTVLGYTASVLADVGQAARNVNSALDQQTRILENVENRRDAVSGVSIDEEVTSLIRLQASFQANARVIQTIDRLLENVVNLL